MCIVKLFLRVLTFYRCGVNLANPSGGKAKIVHGHSYRVIEEENWFRFVFMRFSNLTYDYLVVVNLTKLTKLN